MDITDRKSVEQALRESEERLSAIVDNASAVVYMKDLFGRYLMVNRAYEDWFAIRRREIVGHHLRDVLGDVAYEAVLPRIERALSGEAVRFEARLRRERQRLRRP